MKVDIFLSYHKIILPSVLVFSFLYSTFTVPSYLAKKLSGSLVGCSKKKLGTFSLKWNGIWTRLFFQSKNVYKKDALFVLLAKRYTHRISKYDNKWGETFLNEIRIALSDTYRNVQFDFFSFTFSCMQLRKMHEYFFTSPDGGGRLSCRCILPTPPYICFSFENDF